MVRKIFFLLLVVLLGIVMLSGCGGGGSSASNSSPGGGSGGTGGGAGGTGGDGGGGQATSLNDVLTFHNDMARTGQMLSETILTPANVNSNTFGKLFVLTVDGKVDAQPLYVAQLVTPANGTKNVLYVATENDSIYAFDADSGGILWQRSVQNPGEVPSNDHGCSQVTPQIGITGTPVIDRTSGAHGTIYLVSMSQDGSGQYFQRLHALDLATGAEEFGGPVAIQATYTGTGDNSNGTSVVFDPGKYKARPSLLLLNGVVYTSWGSHCDVRPYTGWIIGYNESTLAQTSVLNVDPNGNGGSFWNSGAAPAADAQGNIYHLAANGTFDEALDVNGFPSQGDYGNAFLKVGVTNQQLGVADYFTMSNTTAESAQDQDLGSGGALVLPDLKDAQGIVRHLAVGAGKDKNIYVVDRENMGKFNPAGDQIYQELIGGLPTMEFGSPAYFNGLVYFGSIRSSLQAFQVENARLSLTPVSQTNNAFPYPGTTPSISANGTANGIVWAVENGDAAVLHAYDAANLAHELYNSNQAGSRDQFGQGNKFVVPTIADGKVYVATTNGVGVFGLR